MNYYCTYYYYVILHGIYQDNECVVIFAQDDPPALCSLCIMVVSIMLNALLSWSFVIHRSRIWEWPAVFVILLYIDVVQERKWV